MRDGEQPARRAAVEEKGILPGGPLQLSAQARQKKKTGILPVQRHSGGGRLGSGRPLECGFDGALSGGKLYPPPHDNEVRPRLHKTLGPNSGQGPPMPLRHDGPESPRLQVHQGGQGFELPGQLEQLAVALTLASRQGRGDRPLNAGELQQVRRRLVFLTPPRCSFLLHLFSSVHSVLLCPSLFSLFHRSAASRPGSDQARAGGRRGERANGRPGRQDAGRAATGRSAWRRRETRRPPGRRSVPSGIGNKHDSPERSAQWAARRKIGVRVRPCADNCRQRRSRGKPARRKPSRAARQAR